MSRRITDWLFRGKGGRKVNFGDYDEEFCLLLRKVKGEIPGVISQAVDL